MVIFMPGLSVSAIKNKWKSLKKDYKAITILRNEGGFSGTQRLELLKAQMMAVGYYGTETKRFKNRGCEHIELLDRLWKDAAKVKKVRIATGMHGANDEGEVKLEAAACHSDSLRRHGQLGGSSTASFQMGPNSVPLRHPWTQAHRYILFNCDELIQIRTMHKERLKARNRSSRPTDYVIDKMHRDEFCDWFRNYVQNMDEMMKHQLPNRVRWLAKGTMTRKRFRTISSSSQPPVPPSQEATASQEATPSQPPAHPSEQATMPSFDYDQSLNDNEIIGDTEVRKVRGGTRMTDVWNLKEDELIPVQFNGNGQPLGNEGGIFNKFTGCVARVANQIPLDAADWRKKRFTIPEPPLGDIVKSWFLKDLGEKWRNYKCSLKQKYFDEAFTPQYVKNNAPTDVNLEQFCKLVDFWYSDAGRHRSHAGKQNRSLQTTVHTAGSKSFARYAHELEKEKQVPINRADLYKAVHMRSDGSPINPDVAEKIRRMEEIGLNDSGSSQTSNEFRVDGSIGWSPSDRYAQVIGPERHGRIRGVGLGPTPSSHPANTNVRSSQPTSSSNERAVFMENRVQMLESEVASLNLQYK
ncbi:hypothetical protein CJ030_MR7G005009 [Morella rubra]|uniref:Myb/SANT-like domain-containing protein n=1 Tax=Morella rubra TaxID=262757 RepID=A0A6A1WSH1_9ROSI|nr:hypothetical protein CJ030_MR7G005009 [Morella rubra]